MTLFRHRRPLGRCAPAPAFLLFAALAAGCEQTSETTGSATPTSLPSLEEAHDRLVEATCEVGRACYAGAWERVARFADPPRFHLWRDPVIGGSSCEAKTRELVAAKTEPRWAALFERGTIEYHPEAVEACAAAIEERGCESHDFALPPAECEEMLKGLVPLGGACTAHEECEGVAYCSIPSLAACEGTCKPTPAVSLTPAGQPCSTTRCALDADCTQVGAPSNFECRRWADIYTAGDGEPCKLPDRGCTGTLACDQPLGEEGVCRPPVEAGGSCSDYGDEYQCVAEHVCKKGGTCVHVLSLYLGEGEACGPAQPCEPTLYCNQYTASPTCKATLPDGEVCYTDEYCQSGLCSLTSFCVSTTTCNVSF